MSESSNIKEFINKKTKELAKTADEVKVHIAVGLMVMGAMISSSAQFSERISFNTQVVAALSPEDLIRESTRPDGRISFVANENEIHENAKTNSFKMQADYSDGSKGQFTATLVEKIQGQDGEVYNVFYSAGHCFPQEKQTESLSFSQPQLSRDTVITIGSEKLGYVVKDEYSQNPKENDFSVFVVKSNEQTFSSAKNIPLTNRIDYATDTASWEFPNMAATQNYPQIRRLRPIAKSGSQIIFLTQPSAGGASGAGIFNQQTGEFMGVLTQGERLGPKGTRAVIIPDADTRKHMVQTAISQIQKT